MFGTERRTTQTDSCVYMFSLAERTCSRREAFPLFFKSLRVRDPGNRFRISGELFVDGYARLQAQLFVIPGNASDELRFFVTWIRLPGYGCIFRKDREPGEAALCADLFIDETVLTIAPCAEGHVACWISVHDVVGPSGRNDYNVAGFGTDGKAPAGLITGCFL